MLKDVFFDTFVGLRKSEVTEKVMAMTTIVFRCLAWQQRVWILTYQ